MRGVIAGIRDLIAARADDVTSRRVLSPLLPLDGIAGRALVDTLGSGTTYA